MSVARRLTSGLIALALVFGTATGAQADTPATDTDVAPLDRTPPRVSYTAGDVSLWRPGAQDWAPAQINTPLAPGDEISTGNQGNLELQVGARGYVRAWGDTQFGLTKQEIDLVQLKVSTGHLALDLNTVDLAQTLAVATPHATFRIHRPGYYRIDVTAAASSLITRRGGQATATSSDGRAASVAASEEVVIAGTATPTVQSRVAPEPDVWDRWNDGRTAQLLDAASARYVSSDVYGASDLDHYGTWRVVPTYGAVWTPRAMPAGWTPYSSGRWISDPHYGWTWVDAAPWGWAPYHYGRWVFIDGFWAWAPGPVVARPIYAPALVAFFGGAGIRVGIGVPATSWVALSWGEPLVPWWGRSGFIGRPSWVGWGGPRIVNNVVIKRTTVVNVKDITVYRNAKVRNAVVAFREDHGRSDGRENRNNRSDGRRSEPRRRPEHVTPAAPRAAEANGRVGRPAPAPTPSAVAPAPARPTRGSSAVDRDRPSVSRSVDRERQAPLRPVDRERQTPSRPVERERPSPTPQFDVRERRERPEATRAGAHERGGAGRGVERARVGERAPGGRPAIQRAPRRGDTPSQPARQGHQSRRGARDRGN